MTRHLPPKTKGKNSDGFKPFAPIEASTAECRRLLYFHADANLNKDEKHPQPLQDPKIHAGLLRATAMIGTHNPKAPNANVAALPLLAHNPGQDEGLPPGSSSRTTHYYRQVGCAGNAADAAYMAFLAKEFVIDGEIRSVGEDFARRGPLWDAALEEGLPQQIAENLSKRLATRFGQAAAEPIDRFLKQIYWPTADGGYCLISPVQSFAMLGETVLRIDEAVRKQQHVVPRESTKVAGANAINAGQLNAEIAGLHPHLRCLPPQYATRRDREDPFQTLLAQLAAQHLFHKGSISHQTAEIVKSAVADPRENAEAKRRFRYNLARAAREVLEEAEALAEQLQAEESCSLLDERFANVSTELKAWLDPRSLGLPEDAPLTEAILESLAGQVYEAVFAKHKLLADSRDLISPELRLEIKRAIQEAL